MEEKNSNVNFSEEIEKKDKISSKFEKERKDWKEKIDGMSKNMRDIYNCSTVLSDMLTARQIALEYTHTLIGVLSKINADLREKKKERFLYYSQSYDLRLDKDPKNMFIDVDLKKQVMLQELFQNHLTYMKGTIDSLDKIYYGIKWRIQLEEYKRGQH